MLRDPERAERVGLVLRALEADGAHPVWVDRAPVFDKATLLHALYQALQLPAWFGFNWDALHDVLVDSGAADAPVVLVFADFELLEQRNPAVAATFLEIVESVASRPGATLKGVARVSDLHGD